MTGTDGDGGGWLPRVLAASGASAVVLLGPADNRSAAYGILLLGAVLGFGWVVVASVLLTGKRAPP